MSVKVIKEQKDGYSSLSIVNNKGEQFKIHYAGGDLYWTMIDYKENNEFIVEKKDVDFYAELEVIFNLIDNDIDCIEWSSEAYGEIEKANKLLISKTNEGFCIKFNQNPNRLFNRKDICAICFCLSGSKLQDIANEFSCMFYRLASKYDHYRR